MNGLPTRLEEVFGQERLPHEPRGQRRAILELAGDRRGLCPQALP